MKSAFRILEMSTYMNEIIDNYIIVSHNEAPVAKYCPLIGGGTICYWYKLKGGFGKIYLSLITSNQGLDDYTPFITLYQALTITITRHDTRLMVLIAMANDWLMLNRS